LLLLRLRRIFIPYLPSLDFGAASGPAKPPQEFAPRGNNSYLLTPEESAVPLCGDLKQCFGYPNRDHNASLHHFKNLDHTGLLEYPAAEVSRGRNQESEILRELTTVPYVAGRACLAPWWFLSSIREELKPPRLKEIEAILYERRDEMARNYGVTEIGIFGSCIHGEATEKSDIDILVAFGQPVGFFRFLELEEQLSEWLGARVDLVTRGALKPHIDRSILSEVVML
jgi:uncharacterized protein